MPPSSTMAMASSDWVIDKIGGLDVVRVEAEKRAGKGGEHVRDRERQQLVAKRVDAQRLRQILVEAYRREIAPDPRPHQSTCERSVTAGQASQRQQIPRHGVPSIFTTPLPGSHTVGFSSTSMPSVPLVTLFQFSTTSRHELGEGERHDGKVEFPQPELEADPADQHRRIRTPTNIGRSASQNEMPNSVSDQDT